MAPPPIRRRRRRIGGIFPYLCVKLDNPPSSINYSGFLYVDPKLIREGTYCYRLKRNLII